MSPTETREWAKLQAHCHRISPRHLRDLFNSDPGRGRSLALGHDDLYVDYSKQRITTETLTLLIDLARSVGLQRGIDAMFDGEVVNLTEGRPALHTALRAAQNRSIDVNGEDVIPAVHRERTRMEAFADEVRSGKWKGHTGRRIRNVVNIGIGGSDLGPSMACQALKDFASPDLRCVFVSNVDASDITGALGDLDPSETLFVVSSKTFSTVETLTNARTARAWLLAKLHEESSVAKHFVAVSTNVSEVEAFGIARENVFAFWDWVGGRYSVHSAIGLVLMLSIGPKGFNEFLAGASAMDTHFQTAPFERNLPVLLGLLGIWNRNFLRFPTHAVLPYDARLADFPAYLQQLEMESNGKSATNDGAEVTFDTAPIVWGAAGTNGQHAFFQLLHQGTSIVPVDFIGVIRPAHDLHEHHRLLVANLFAQSQALAMGREPFANNGNEARDLSAPFQRFPGNRPSTTILLRELTPYALGQLIALYEHKVFTQGWIWGIDSFDQWGVELGKVLAGRLLEELQSDGDCGEHDSSTNALIARFNSAYREGGHPDESRTG